MILYLYWSEQKKRMMACVAELRNYLVREMQVCKVSGVYCCDLKLFGLVSLEASLVCLRRMVPMDLSVTDLCLLLMIYRANSSS